MKLKQQPTTYHTFTLIQRYITCTVLLSVSVHQCAFEVQVFPGNPFIHVIDCVWEVYGIFFVDFVVGLFKCDNRRGQMFQHYVRFEYAKHGLYECALSL